MSIRPIDFNGMLQRTDDVSTLKHHEDSKPLVDQQNIQAQVEKKEDAVRHQVRTKEDSSGTNNQADAREEGRGLYYSSDRAKKSKKEEPKEPGFVKKKSFGGSFDIKI